MFKKLIIQFILNLLINLVYVVVMFFIILLLSLFAHQYYLEILYITLSILVVFLIYVLVTQSWYSAIEKINNKS